MNIAQRLLVVAVLVTITFLALMSVTPAFAGSRENEGFCFEESQHVVLPLRRGAWDGADGADDNPHSTCRQV